jgi:hypothetical protein
VFVSTPNAPGLRPSKLFSFPAISSDFSITLFAHALFYKTLQPCTGASAIFSRKESRSLYALNELG